MRFCFLENQLKVKALKADIVSCTGWQMLVHFRLCCCLSFSPQFSLSSYISTTFYNLSYLRIFLQLFTIFPIYVYFFKFLQFFLPSYLRIFLQLYLPRFLQRPHSNIFFSLLLPRFFYNLFYLCIFPQLCLPRFLLKYNCLPLTA